MICDEITKSHLHDFTFCIAPSRERFSSTRAAVRRYRIALISIAWAIVAVASLATSDRALANGADLPPEILLPSYIKLDEQRAQLIVRVPLVLLASFSLPKRGPGYLDLGNIEPRLRQAAAAAGRQIELSADGVTLAPTTKEVRLSLLSDRSFATYANALAHLQGPPLPADTDLFWNQGFLDVQLEYALTSRASNVWVRVNVAPELGQRLKLRLGYLAYGEPQRNYDIPAGSGWIPLDPRGYEAAWLFARFGFVDAFAVSTFAFIACLVAPFRRFRAKLLLVLVYAALQAVTLTAAAKGAVADVEVGWLPYLAGSVLAAAVVLLAIGNLASPRLRVRAFAAAVVGALVGFGLGRFLAELGQYSGTHPAIATVSFNIGVVLGEIVCVALVAIALRLLYASALGAIVGLVVVSALLGHLGWHWMADGGQELLRQLGNVPAASLWLALGAVGLWLVPALAAAAIAFVVLRRADATMVPTLLQALRPPGGHRNGSNTP